MTDIKISVLTPIYNHKIEYVRQCLESLVAQTMQDIEFILIDNGATQESKDLIAEFEKKDSRFRVLHIEKNEGYGKAMNLGLDNARGEYIGIVESDDWVESEMFQKLYDIAKIKDVDIVKSVYYEETPDSKKVINAFNDESINRILTQEEIEDFLSSHASPWSMLYRKNMLDEHDIRISKGNGAVAKDLGFVIKAFICAKEIYITDTPFYHYNIFNPNASMKVKNIRYIINMLLKEYDDIYNWFEEQSKHNEIVKKKRAFIDKRLFKNIYWHYKKSNIQNDNMLLRRIIKYIKKRIIDKSNFSNSEIAELNNIINQIPNSILENIFSIKNTINRKYKVLTILGIKIKLKKRLSEFEKLLNNQNAEIAKLKEFIYQTNYIPQKVASLHQQVFPQFRNIHNNDEIVIVGCGPTLNYYTNIKNAKHIALNRAIRNSNILFDYAFIWDLPATNLEEPEFIKEFLQYDCIKFVGRFLCETHDMPMDLNLSYKNKLYRCYSSSRAGLGIPTCDKIIHQDISIYPLADFMSISFGALNFAAYTHPKKIYLVGLDTAQTPCFDGKEHQYHMKDLIIGYNLFKRFFDRYYPDIEVISVNPVGLKGMFKDVYTQSYVDAHPELLDENVEILEKIQS